MRMSSLCDNGSNLLQRLFIFLGFLGILSLQAGNASAASFDTLARQAVLVDLTTGAVLLEKDAHTKMPPASMSKLMTAYLLFERLKNGSISIDDTLPISSNAARKGGSKMFLRDGERVRVEDLIRGIVIQSGNDACIAVAEGLAGSESAFAEMMNAKAKELGLENSNFTNATGWPDPDHYMTASDLAKLAQHLLQDFPDYYHFYSERQFTFNQITQKNRNPTLGVIEGADGMKTGYTQASGYGLTASAEREGRRLIMVINGLESINARASEAERLINWGFGFFQTHEILRAGETVETAELWLGQKRTVPLVLKENLKVTLPRTGKANLKVTVRYEGPVRAPVYKGEKLGTLVLTAPGIDTIERQLFAAETVERLGPAGRVIETLGALVSGTGR
jgi:D-alanyl-D-alanine carboxypeptidase (penicillin-binding protein 5/6)